MPDELQLVEWLRQNSYQPDFVRLGIGDDMAILDLPEKSTVNSATNSTRILVSSDMLLDGVHFDTRTQPLELIGRKAIACSLSDCAAMAVKPVSVTISLAIPSSQSLEQTKRLFHGMNEIAREFNTAIAGGDTTFWPHALVIDIAIQGIPFAGIEPVRRTGAKVGDLIAVTGPLGGSLRGKHLSFTPRIREAETLSRTLGEHLHAMMDISDGLSLDLWRMCEASHVGAVLDEAKLQQVISNDAMFGASNDHPTPLDHALSDGEDFELLVAISNSAPASRRIADGQLNIAGVPLYIVGEIAADRYRMRRKDGTLTKLEPKGYVH